MATVFRGSVDFKKKMQTGNCEARNIPHDVEMDATDELFSKGVGIAQRLTSPMLSV